MSQTKQQELLDIIDSFLAAYDEEIYYKDLTKHLIESGAWLPYGQKPDQIVYSALHQDIRRYGSASAFRFCGKGIFITARAQGAEAVAILLPKLVNSKADVTKKRPHETVADHNARLEHLHDKEKCGNCQHITFSAHNEFSLNLGECTRWSDSGRACTRGSSEACSFWERASIVQMEQRLARREEWRLYLIEQGFYTFNEKDVERAETFTKRRKR